MNEIERLYQADATPVPFIEGYLAHLKTLLGRLDAKAIAKFLDVLLTAREKGTHVFFIGNGGSAATASHFANDIAIGTRSKGKPFRAVSLTDNVAVMTAIANDYGYEYVFTKQLETLLQSGDVVVAISASGNSPNVVKAIDYAKSKGAFTVGLTGFDGGTLRKNADLCLHVPTEKGEYGPVEDIHMVLDHLLGAYLMEYCKREKELSAPKVERSRTNDAEVQPQL